MLRRLVGAAVAAALAGCGGDDGAEPDADAQAREEVSESRFEVSVDTQRIANPDAEVAPSENPDN